MRPTDLPSQAPQGHEWLTVRHAAARLDMSQRTIRRYVAQGRLNAYRVGPHMVRIDATELDRFATQRRLVTARETEQSA